MNVTCREHSEHMADVLLSLKHAVVHPHQVCVKYQPQIIPLSASSGDVTLATALLTRPKKSPQEESIATELPLPQQSLLNLDQGTESSLKYEQSGDKTFNLLPHTTSSPFHPLEYEDFREISQEPEGRLTPSCD